MCAKYEAQLSQVELQLSQVPCKDEALDKFVDFGLSFIGQLGATYDKADVKVKKMILGSILSGNLVFEDEKYRTLPFIEAITLLSRFNGASRSSEIKKGDSFSTISLPVLRAGLEPARSR